MKKILITLLSLSLLLGCSKKDLVHITENSTIVAFGDSLTYGYGANHSESYPEFLKRKINFNVINEGVNGNTTQDGLQRIESVLSEHTPTLIIIGLGGNDMLRKIPEETTKENLTKMIKISKDKGIQVVLLATPRPSIFGAITSLSDATFYKIIAKENNVPLIENVYSKWLSKEEYKSDLIHLNAKGYEKVAEDIYDFLKKHGAIN